MRNALLLAAALAVVPLAPAPAPALAQQPSGTARPSVPKLVLSDEQKAELQQSLLRGRALAILDQSARLTSADMLTRIPDPAGAGIAGWVALPEGSGVTVTYYAPADEGYEAVYKAQVLSGRVTSPQVYAPGSRPPLVGSAARMAAARQAAEGVENERCGGPSFNLLVLPPEGDGPVLVYQMSPRMEAAKVPAAGHYRIAVAADGTVGETVPLGGPCADLDLPPVPAGQRPRPVTVNARSATLPNELHVFLSLWTGRPIVVATGTGPVRLWGVTGQGVGELQQ